MITITTLAQLAEALADGLRLEDPTQRGRGLSETEALELFASGAELISDDSDRAQEVPRKHGRSGALNDLAAFADAFLVADERHVMADPNWKTLAAEREARRNALLFGGSFVEVGPNGFRDVFASPRVAKQPTGGQELVHGGIIEWKSATLRPWLAEGMADALDLRQRCETHMSRAIRLELIPPSRS